VLGAQSRPAGELVCSLAAPLTALPLYGAARRLTDETTARFSVALYLFTCSVTVFAILAMDLPRALLAIGVIYAGSGPGMWLWRRWRKTPETAP
jgi:hypothetical protein